MTPATARPAAGPEAAARGGGCGAVGAGVQERSPLPLAALLGWHQLRWMGGDPRCRCHCSTEGSDHCQDPQKESSGSREVAEGRRGKRKRDIPLLVDISFVAALRSAGKVLQNYTLNCLLVTLFCFSVVDILVKSDSAQEFELFITSLRRQAACAQEENEALAAQILHCALAASELQGNTAELNPFFFSLCIYHTYLNARLRLHEEKVIKDRRHHLKTYPNCFVAKELIDWLIDHKEASDRDTAIKLVQKLLDHSIIHHVCDEHKEFKDAKLFYRFRKDDGTFPLDNEVKVFMRGQRLYEKLMSSENTLLQAREEEGVKYERTFVASEFIDWLMQEGEATTRTEAEQLGRRLLEHGIIQHVSNKHHFMDSNLLYQCRMNFRRRRRLMELLTERSRLMPESHDSPFCLRKQNHDNRKHTSFLSVSPTKEIKIVSAVRRSSMSSCGSSGYFSSSPTLSSSPPVLCNPKSVLKRPVTADELLMPGAPYVRKTFTIVGDAVGWGFVVRGSKPCHIQAVDPSGPAAAAGMKVCQFVVSVNGLNVLHVDYRTVSNLILTGPRTIVMEVMEEIEP
ncbi:PREDICTED: DEP domain-containing mTOR-interacting protein-like [Tinamus guttatus]|nr:PREDICTED: DEP domain-containing mTOR-interacting protein-like [Tinamus guttatus]